MDSLQMTRQERLGKVKQRFRAGLNPVAILARQKSQQAPPPPTRQYVPAQVRVPHPQPVSNETVQALAQHRVPRGAYQGRGRKVGLHRRFPQLGPAPAAPGLARRPRPRRLPRQ